MDACLRALITHELIPQDVMEYCQPNRDESLLEAVIRLGIVSETTYLKTISKLTKIPFYDLYCGPVLTDSELSVDILKRLRCVPIREERGVLTIGVANPFDLTTEKLRSLAKREVKTVVVSPRPLSLVLHLLETAMHNSRQQILYTPIGSPGLSSNEKQEDELTSMTSLADSFLQNMQDEEEYTSPVISIVNKALIRGKKAGASEICFEMCPQGSKIRARIHGRWVSMPKGEVPKNLSKAMAARVKILANMDIAEQGLPQAGFIEVSLEDGNDISAEVTSLPSIYGEDLCVRYRTNCEKLPTYGNLALPASIDQKLTEILAKKGSILLAGAAQSGKSTTSYVLAKHFFIDRGKKIMTLERENLCLLPNTSQISFSGEENAQQTLSVMLHARADAILLGKYALNPGTILMIQYSQTPIIARITAETAYDAMWRLIHMGGKSLFSSQICAILCQHLVPIVCRKCRQRTKDKEFPYRAGGCENCYNTGYSHRIPLFHAMFIEDKVKQLIHSNSWKKLQRLKRLDSRHNFIQQAKKLARRGWTTEQVVLSL